MWNRSRDTGIALLRVAKRAGFVESLSALD
jgi:hypothetical protein